MFSDINKNSLRITSYENGDAERSSTSVDMLPLDIEIFQNLVDNICRKFNPGKGENLLCFGGCAVFSDEGVLQRVENFLPQSPALLSSWLKVKNPQLLMIFCRSFITICLNRFPHGCMLPWSQPPLKAGLSPRVMSVKRSGKHCSMTKTMPMHWKRSGWTVPVLEEQTVRLSSE